MCGIAGIVDYTGKSVLLSDIEAMCAVLTHRGPDEDGFFVTGGTGFGMRRLKIIDLETGRQPVQNEDGSIRVVFNGEIYNFRELRRSLEARGHAFKTASDSEVIAHLYEDYGPRCVTELRGMFAIAVWDERNRSLMLARDRLGKKPLYYRWRAGRLAFASEVKSLLQLPEIEPALNWASVNHLFSFLSTPPDASIVQGIAKLEPGHILLLGPGAEPRLERYWDCVFEPDYGRSEVSFIEELREILTEAVRLRLVSDVPVGAFLSGGVDSSAVVAAMARLSSAPVKTFSVGFSDPAYDELAYARQIATRFGTDHHEMVLEPDALGFIDEIAWYLDEPFGDSSAIPTYMVSKLAAGHVKVLLSGDGGDEVFAGYERYQRAERERRYERIPKPLRSLMGAVGTRLPDGAVGRNFLKHHALDGPERYLDGASLFRPDQKAGLFRPETYALIRAAGSAERALQLLGTSQGHWLSTLQYFDLHAYLPLDILTKVDRMSMAHSVEARAPLLDHKLVEFAARIPPEMKLRGGRTKHIFKEAMRGVLPDAIIDRPKHGFAVPLGRWFRGRLGEFVRDLLLSPSSTGRGIFEPSYVEKLLHWHETRRNLDLQLWTLISFELWCRTFLDGQGRRARPPETHRDRARAETAAAT